MTKANEKITVRFTIDFFGQKIIGTKASFNKAAKGYGPEYEELSAKMAAHPTFALTEKEQKHKSTKAKRTYDGLDFPFMEAYILTQSDSDALMAEYKSVKAMAKSCGSNVYALTKKWFLGTFATEEEPFDKILSPPEAIDGLQRYVHDLTHLYESDEEPEFVLSLEELDEKYMNNYYGFDVDALRMEMDFDESEFDEESI